MILMYTIVLGLINIRLTLKVFSFEPNCSTRGRTYKQYCIQFKLNVRGHFFIQRCAGAWNSLANYVETFPTLVFLNSKYRNVNLDFLYS